MGFVHPQCVLNLFKTCLVATSNTCPGSSEGEGFDKVRMPELELPEAPNMSSISSALQLLAQN